ncbi:hypothetical protein, partial [Klebsiella michiganensis]|uniref:hypothetical protein n=1 Tax=Klebsiella michiganensis TaxID=1134687 RepID=UPI0019537FD4
RRAPWLPRGAAGVAGAGEPGTGAGASLLTPVLWRLLRTYRWRLAAAQLRHRAIDILFDRVKFI